MTSFPRLWPATLLLLLLLGDGCSADCANAVARKPGMDGELAVSPPKVPAAKGAML